MIRGVALRELRISNTFREHESAWVRAEVCIALAMCTNPLEMLVANPAEDAA